MNHTFTVEDSTILEICDDCDSTILGMDIEYYTMIVQQATLETIKSSINLNIDSLSDDIQTEYYEEFGD